MADLAESARIGAAGRYHARVIGDAALPPGFTSPTSTIDERSGVCYSAARWRPEELAALARNLQGTGTEALASLQDEELLDAWSETVEAFLDPGSPERGRLEEALPRLTGLSSDGLQAGLEAILGGVRRAHAAVLLERARGLSGEGLLLVILAGNVPALGVQPLLPALALRRPVVLKAASVEPLFTPAFVRALGERLPVLRRGVAALTWPGGEAALEEPLLAAAGQVVAYGGAETVESLQRRATCEVLDYGPKLSFAALGDDAPADQVALGLARDVALFDQRGCLSIQAVFTAGEPLALARAMARSLEAVAREWPPGDPAPAAAARVHQLRAEARMRGLFVADLPLRVGSVVVENLPQLLPSPGLRTVRVHRFRAPEDLLGALEPYRGKLQGAALAGDPAWALRPALEALGVSRCAPPGQLQSPDAAWHNGGRDPLLSLASRRLSYR